MKYERDFKGVWIPKQIWLDENLGWSEKCLLVEIESLDNEKGCYSGNKYFSDFFGLSENRISKMISSLRDKGYITVDIKIDSDHGFKKKRTIKVDKIKFHGIVQKSLAKTPSRIGENAIIGVGENDTYNNTLINNTNNIKDSLSDNKLSDVAEAIKIYKEIENLPKVISFSDKRKKHINARVKEYGLKTFKETLIKASESSFLKSHLGMKNFYDFDWIINPNNFLKILEDKYQDRNKISNEKEIGLEELFG